MRGNTNVALAAIAAYAATLPIVSGASSTPVNAIPAIGQGQGYVVLDSPHIAQTPGSWEERSYTVVLHFLLERFGDEAAEQVRANDAADALMDAWRTEDGLAGGLVAICEMREIDPGKFYEVGGMSYQSVDATLHFSMYSGQTYQPGT